MLRSGATRSWESCWSGNADCFPSRKIQNPQESQDWVKKQLEDQGSQWMIHQVFGRRPRGLLEGT